MNNIGKHEISSHSVIMNLCQTLHMHVKENVYTSAKVVERIQTVNSGYFFI